MSTLTGWTHRGFRELVQRVQDRLNRPATPAGLTYVYRFSRRSVDFLGLEWTIENSRRDAVANAWANGIDTTDWTPEVTLLDIYAEDQRQPDDCLQVTVRLEPPAA